MLRVIKIVAVVTMCWLFFFLLVLESLFSFSLWGKPVITDIHTSHKCILVHLYSCLLRLLIWLLWWMNCNLKLFHCTSCSSLWSLMCTLTTATWLVAWMCSGTGVPNKVGSDYVKWMCTPPLWLYNLEAVYSYVKFNKFQCLLDLTLHFCPVLISVLI